jgi:hypothetical protein
LDTSILLGSRICWDAQFDLVRSYFDVAKIRRISSKRAYHEAKGVLERNRREILKFLDSLNTEFTQPGHPVINEAEVDRLSIHYCATIENEKICSAITLFTHKNIYDITNALRDGSLLFDTYKLKIGKAFQTALNSLAIDCRTREDAFIRRYDICPQVYDQMYDSEQYRLMALINYIDDVKILLDSYFLQDRILEGNLFFVTTDATHILRHKNDIEGILAGLSVSHPRDHYTAS